MDRCILTLHVDDKYHVRHAGHGAYTREPQVETVDLTLDQQSLFLGQLFDITCGKKLFHPVQFQDALVHGGPVGQHAAQPAFGDEWHAAAHGLIADRFLRLALGANKHDNPTIGNRITDNVIRDVNRLHRLLQINDMNTIAFGEDIRLHTRVPLVGPVAEMDAALKQRLHGNNCHLYSFFSRPATPTVPGVGWGKFSGDGPRQRVNVPLRDA